MTTAATNPAPRSAGQHLSGSRAVRRWLVHPGVALLSVVALFFVYLVPTPASGATTYAAAGEVLSLFAMLAPSVAVVLVVAVLVALTARLLPGGIQSPPL